MTVTKTPNDQNNDFRLAKEVHIDVIRKEVEKAILEALDPYIQIEVELSHDFNPPHIIADEALLHYVESENIR